MKAKYKVGTILKESEDCCAEVVTKVTAKRYYSTWVYKVGRTADKDIYPIEEANEFSLYSDIFCEENL